MNQEHRQRQLAEALPKEGEDIVAFALRTLEMHRREAQKRGLAVISQKSFVRKIGKLRKDLESSCGTLRKGSDRPIDQSTPACAEHMRKITETRQKDQTGSRFIASLFATAERIRRDPKFLKSFPRERRPDQTWEEFWKDRDARMVKPWKGRAGREAANEAGNKTKRKSARQLQSIEWHRKGITDSEIARKHGCSVKTVQRDLKGHR